MARQPRGPRKTQLQQASKASIGGKNYFYTQQGVLVDEAGVQVEQKQAQTYADLGLLHPYSPPTPATEQPEVQPAQAKPTAKTTSESGFIGGMGRVGAQITKDVLRAAFPDVYKLGADIVTAYQKGSKDSQQKDQKEKELNQSKQDSLILRYSINDNNALLKQNGELIRQQLANQERSLTVLRKISDGVDRLVMLQSLSSLIPDLPGLGRGRGRGRLGGLLRGRAGLITGGLVAGAAAIGAGAYLMSGQRDEEPQTPAPETPAAPEQDRQDTGPTETITAPNQTTTPGLSAAEAREPDTDTSLSFKAEDIKFESNKLLFDVDTLTIDADNLQQGFVGAAGGAKPYTTIGTQPGQIGAETVGAGGPPKFTTEQVRQAVEGTTPGGAGAAPTPTAPSVPGMPQGAAPFQKVQTPSIAGVPEGAGLAATGFAGKMIGPTPETQAMLGEAAGRPFSFAPSAEGKQQIYKDIERAGRFEAPQVPQEGKRQGWWTTDKQQYAVNYLMKNAGLSEIGARGLVARWAHVEAAKGPGEVNPQSGAMGIAQWLGSRKKGVELGNFENQLAHAARELNTSEKRAGDVLRNAKTAEEAARGASIYERAEGYNPSTGLDNFTQKTLKNIPNIAGGVAPPTTPQQLETLKTRPSEVPGTAGFDIFGQPQRQQTLSTTPDLLGEFGQLPKPPPKPKTSDVEPSDVWTSGIKDPYQSLWSNQPKGLQDRARQNYENIMRPPPPPPPEITPSEPSIVPGSQTSPAGNLQQNAGVNKRDFDVTDVPTDPVRIALKTDLFKPLDSIPRSGEAGISVYA